MNILEKMYEAIDIMKDKTSVSTMNTDSGIIHVIHERDKVVDINMVAMATKFNAIVISEDLFSSMMDLGGECYKESTGTEAPHVFLSGLPLLVSFHTEDISNMMNLMENYTIRVMDNKGEFTDFKKAGDQNEDTKYVL